METTKPTHEMNELAKKRAQDIIRRLIDIEPAQAQSDMLKRLKDREYLSSVKIQFDDESLVLAVKIVESAVRVIKVV